MNPDNNQPSEPTIPPAGDMPAGAPPADAPAETPVETPAETPAETPVETPAPAAPEAPAFGAVAMPEAPAKEAPAAPESPESPAAPEAPALGSAEPTGLAEPTEPAESTEPAEPAEAPAAPEEPDSSSMSASANFVGDAPVPKAEPKPEDEEEELVPANPVPGSIGSALIYSDTAPNNAIPVNEYKKKHKKLFSFGDNAGGSMSKTNIRTILVIVAAVALVAALVVVLIFIFGGNGSSKKNANTSTNTKPTVTTPVVSSLTCTKEGGSETFTSYGAIDSGEEDIIVMYTDDELTSIGSIATLDYGNTEAAESGLNSIRNSYTVKVENLGLPSDPFQSSYDAKGSIVTVTHQAEADDLDSKSAKIFDIVTLRGELVTDIETLDDTYTEAGYECTAK